MSTDGLDVRVRELVGAWPVGLSVAGIFPESTDTDWCGRAALKLAHAAAERRAPALILDLAPASSGLARRFGARSSRGFAETAAGDASLLDITRRDDGDVLYIPNGLQTAGVVLAGSSAAKTLADRVRDRNRVLLAVLDRHGLRSAASAGWLDGVVRLGEQPGDGRQGPGSDLTDLGRLEPGPGRTSAESAEPQRRDARGPEAALGRSGVATGDAEDDREPAEPESVPPLVMPDNHDPSGRWSRVARRTLTALAIVVLTGVAAAALLDGTGSGSTDGGRGTRVASTRGGGGDSASASTSRASAPDSSRTHSGALPGSPSSNPGGSRSPSSRAPVSTRSSSTADDGDSRSTMARGDTPVGTSDGRTETDRGENGGGVSRSPLAMRSGSTASPGVLSSPNAVIRRLSESLVDRIRGYFLQQALLKEGKAECRELVAAYDRADRLFVQLSARFGDVQDRIDSAAGALYRERADDMEAVDRSFQNSGCRD